MKLAACDRQPRDIETRAYFEIPVLWAVDLLSGLSLVQVKRLEVYIPQRFCVASSPTAASAAPLQKRSEYLLHFLVCYGDWDCLQRTGPCCVLLEPTTINLSPFGTMDRFQAEGPAKGGADYQQPPSDLPCVL